MPISFEFLGGPLDGKKVYRSSGEHRDAKLARFLHVVTAGGSQGRWFQGLSPELLDEPERRRFDDGDFSSAVFEVAGKEQVDNEVLVRIRHRLH